MRVIGSDGENIGIMKTETALHLAQEKGLDLVEIAASAVPPVVRIIDFDKFRYQKEKEMKKQRLAQKVKELKQVRVTPRAGLNDLKIKAKKAGSFLEEGHKVEINLFLRGREKGNKEWGLNKLREFLLLITVPHQVTMEPRWGGRGFSMQIAKNKQTWLGKASRKE